MEFDASLLVVMAIFGIAYLLLKVTVFDRLLRILQRRERRIEEARTGWQSATATAEETLAEERRRLLAARREATARRDALRREAQEQRRLLLEEAKTRTLEQLVAARTELDGEVAREREVLATRVESLAARIGERLVGRAV